MGLKVTVQIDTTVPSGGRIRVVNQSVTGPAGAPGTNGTNGVGVPTGGTTGQALTKASNTNYDTTWTTIQSGIPATLLDAKGDLIVASAADTAARLAVGANGQALYANSAATNGTNWADTIYKVTRSTLPSLPEARYAGQSTFTAQTNTVRASLVAITKALSLTGLDLSIVTAGSAGCLVRVAIYRLDTPETNTNGTLVYDAGTVSGASLGQKTITFGSAITLQPGLYAMATVSDTSTNIGYSGVSADFPTFAMMRAEIVVNTYRGIGYQWGSTDNNSAYVANGYPSTFSFGTGSNVGGQQPIRALNHVLMYWTYS
jgi:hypothetical protein